ncbi:sigma-70 family RNA polymerase sigma factor [Ihubacter sp. mB4P-1]|uniref:sigma-70 family RNA polymerase sigma factor n=1 Tax=Ihubacter sp. mB4P-1 TaxID=3242370 RepID=UPI00137AF7A3
MTYKYVPVAKEDTYELIRRAQSGDEDAKALLCEQNTGLVKKIALKFASGDYELDDLIQIGYIGLLKAVYKFETDYDVMFSTYAVPMIMGEMKRHFRDTGKIKASRSLKAEISMLKRIQEKLTAETGASPRVSEIAQAMGTSNEHVLEVMEAASALGNVMSLDNLLVEEEYDACSSQGSPENNLDSIMIKKEISQLEDKAKQVIILRYYRDMTQQEIAKILGVSQVQVSRIEKRALAQIRDKMAE